MYTYSVSGYDVNNKVRIDFKVFPTMTDLTIRKNVDNTYNWLMSLVNYSDNKPFILEILALQFEIYKESSSS